MNFSYSFFGYKITVLVLFSFVKKSLIAFNWDSKLIPILIVFFKILGSLLDKEIKIVSSYFSNSEAKEDVGGPIIIFAPLFIISLIALFNCSLLSEPLSLGIMIILSSSISSKASCVESSNDVPKSL